MKPCLFILLLFASAFCCAQTPVTHFSKDSFTTHVKTLSSDAFEGRKPGTNGEAKTVAYLEKCFRELGIEPGNGNSYVQDVPLVDIRTKPDSVITVQTAKGPFVLRINTDFITWTESKTPVSVDNIPLVFAGYGIVAPEYKWNDYTGLDVKGKIVLVLEGEPAEDSSLFRGETMTWYGLWKYKVSEAVTQGAKGCLVISRTTKDVTWFSRRINGYIGGRMYLDEGKEKKAFLELPGFITEESAKKILLASEMDTGIISLAAKQGFRGSALPATVSAKIFVEPVYLQSKNVIAKITGIERPDECIVYTAHWDHLGIGRPDAKGDSIYNGALDDAAGTAAVLEMARVFKMQPPPKRTILFLATTAEEKGLLGSEWYTAHPVIPMHKTVLNINMDGYNPFGYRIDIFLAGQGLSTAEDYLAEEAAKLGRYINKEPDNTAVIYRSDQAPFIRVGVPAIFMGSGNILADSIKDARHKTGHQDFGKYRWHQPGDEFDENRWDVEGGFPDVELLYRLGRRMVNENIWPQWKDGTEFKAVREASMRNAGK